MDDDITFGASVWTVPDNLLPTKQRTPSSSPALSTQDGFDDFDNFGTPAETLAASEDEADDDFGDFGDFGDGQGAPVTPGFTSGFNEDVGYAEDVWISGPSKGWRPLRLNPMPSTEDLQEQVDNILGPLWAHDNTSHLTDEEIRQVGGLNQTLVTAESRQLYNMLLPPTTPSFQPVNWTRSRIRRRHLISLGVPVNLDEVLPRANGRLPMLEITTRPMSAPPGPRTPPKSQASTVINSSRGGSSNPGSPQMTTGPSAATQLRLGPRPVLDEAKISHLLDLSSDSLKLLPVTEVESFLADMKEQTANTSALLTYLLQTRDALQQDSETYNKLIGELVGEAQKIKTGKRPAGGRRGSGIL